MKHLQALVFSRLSLVIFFTLFTALAFFLSAAPKIDKPVNAQAWSLSAGTPTSTRVTFTCGGCPNANVEIFVLATTSNGSAVLDSSGTMGTRTTWNWNYGSATGTHRANLVAFGSSIVATTTVTLPAPPTTTPCTFQLTTTTAVADTNVAVRVLSGDGGRFLGFIADSGGNVVTAGTSTTGTINILAPPSAGTYFIGVRDDDSGGPTCSTSFSNQLTVTAAPPAGFPFTLGSASVSGTTATFSISPAAGVGSILFLKDLSTSIPIPTGATSIQWTGAAGAHQAVISAFGVDVSNTVSFTLVSAGFPFTLGDPPTISGTTATFSITPAAGVGSILFLKDLSTSIPIPTGATSIAWTGAAGAHQAVISAFGVDVSNTVPFTLASSGFPFALLVNNVTGNTVTFAITPTPGPSVIVIKDSSGARQLPDPDSTNNASPQWTGPNGTFTAVVSAFATDVSNTVTFTLPSGTTTGGACDKAKNKFDVWPSIGRGYICTGTFDSFAFENHNVGGILNGLVFQLTGEDQIHPEINGVTGIANTGALAASGKLVTAMYSHPPVSGVDYFASQFHKFNPVQPAYAQTTGGIGYNALAPVQPIWEAFRNISYVGFIIVFVVIGFMIMFRAHISPQAVATVQDSLPRIVIALILVTFSYAIAGLMIDIMFLFLNVIINGLKLAKVLDDGADAVFTRSIFGIVWKSWGEIFKTVVIALKTVIDDIVTLPGYLDGIIGLFGGGVAALVVGVAILFVMFRVFFMLLIAYATIIIMTIVAPFYFLFQALPGNNGAKDWFKQMAANIAVFPVTAIMLLFAGILADLSSLGATGLGKLTPQQIGQFPLLSGDIDSGALGALIGIGFLLMTPSAADMVKKAIGAQGQGGAAGAFAPGLAAVGAAGGFLGRRATESSAGQAFKESAAAGGEARRDLIRERIPRWAGGGTPRIQKVRVVGEKEREPG